jgi:hypothetical protein
MLIIVGGFVLFIGGMRQKNQRKRKAATATATTATTQSLMHYQ